MTDQHGTTTDTLHRTAEVPGTTLKDASSPRAAPPARHAATARHEPHARHATPGARATPPRSEDGAMAEQLAQEWSRQAEHDRIISEARWFVAAFFLSALLCFLVYAVL